MNSVEVLREKLDKYRLKLKEKRLLLGGSDGAMISRFPSGRFELEEEILMYQNMIKDIEDEIKRLEKV